MTPRPAISAALAAPSGYPPSTPRTSAEAPAPDTPNSLDMGSASRLASRCGMPSSLTAALSTKNGNSDGIMTSPQVASPPRTPPEAASGQPSSASSAAAASAHAS